MNYLISFKELEDKAYDPDKSMIAEALIDEIRSTSADTSQHDSPSHAERRKDGAGIMASLLRELVHEAASHPEKNFEDAPKKK